MAPVGRDKNTGKPVLPAKVLKATAVRAPPGRPVAAAEGPRVLRRRAWSPRPKEAAGASGQLPRAPGAANKRGFAESFKPAPKRAKPVAFLALGQEGGRAGRPTPAEVRSRATAVPPVAVVATSAAPVRAVARPAALALAAKLVARYSVQLSKATRPTGAAYVRA